MATATIAKPEATHPQAEVYSKILGAKKVGTPLIGITTSDAEATIDGLYKTIRAFPKLADCMIVQWDLHRGIVPLGKVSKEVLDKLFAMNGQEISPEELKDPTTALTFAERFPEDSVLFIHNAHKFVHEIVVSQPLANLRNLFKQDGRTIIMLGPELPMPSHLQESVLMFDEPLPSRTQLQEVLQREVDTAAEHYKKSFKAPAGNQIDRAVDALQGLNMFSAEQVTALSMTPHGLDMPTLWLRKKQLIESTPGLAVIDDAPETFDTIGGLHNIKSFMTKYVSGNEPPQAFVFIDEIEKMLGGSKGDSSGVSQGFLGTLLTYMQDSRATGVILVSPPGCGKSAIAKAAGKAANVPTIMLDLNGMKGSLVGESEQNLRRALKVVTAVSNKNAFFIATCNSLTSLPPELRRRFTFGTFFFDLPDAEERDMIWNIYVNSFRLDPNQPLPDSEGWSGANIHDCCHAAYKLNCSIMEAQQYIVPISKAAGEEISALRKQAEGRFLSASKPGLYVMPAACGIEAPSVDDPDTVKKGRGYKFME